VEIKLKMVIMMMEYEIHGILCSGSLQEQGEENPSILYIYIGGLNNETHYCTIGKGS
jgi:hypothetical protein